MRWWHHYLLQALINVCLELGFEFYVKKQVLLKFFSSVLDCSPPATLPFQFQKFSLWTPRGQFLKSKRKSSLLSDLVKNVAQNFIFSWHFLVSKYLISETSWTRNLNRRSLVKKNWFCLDDPNRLTYSPCILKRQLSLLTESPSVLTASIRSQYNTAYLRFSWSWQRLIQFVDNFLSNILAGPWSCSSAHEVHSNDNKRIKLTQKTLQDWRQEHILCKNTG